MVRKTRRSSSCKRGTIRRAGYSRRVTRSSRRIYVPASCIPDVGAPGKGLASGEPGIGRLREGDLSRFGYDNVMTLSAGQRHLALARAVRAYGALSLFRKLNAVYVYTRRSSPVSSRIFKADRDWVRATYMAA
jgi:hypothetical protein